MLEEGLHAGSSPLTRGKLTVKTHTRGAQRLIPAHAEKTARGPGGAALGAAHPRSRGENARLGGPITSGPGSSPLTRGKRLVGTDRFFRSGLIPAHAGKTLIRTQRPNTAVAHPRSRGENAPSSTIWTMLAGSSPLTRGKLPGVLHLITIVRLIPAHAGKTTRRAPPDNHREAHPRSRGENAVVDTLIADRAGSSPLTRGKPTTLNLNGRSRRLIPAHAGKTSEASSSPSGWAAHPRSRGENWRLLGGSCWHSGSSPLTRGKRPGLEASHASIGLIPAHAGKTASLLLALAAVGAHPRSRGENVRVG